VNPNLPYETLKRAAGFFVFYVVVSYFLFELASLFGDGRGILLNGILFFL